MRGTRTVRSLSLTMFSSSVQLQPGLDSIAWAEVPKSRTVVSLVELLQTGDQVAVTFAAALCARLCSNRSQPNQAPAARTMTTPTTNSVRCVRNHPRILENTPNQTTRLDLV